MEPTKNDTASGTPVETAIQQYLNSVLDSPSAKLKRVAVDETAVKLNGTWHCFFSTIYRYKTTFDVQLFKRQVTDLAAVFLHGVAEKYDFEDAVFLVDYFEYRTSLVRLGLSGRVGYTDRNLSEKWFHTLKMQVNHFHNSGVGSRLSVYQ